MSSAAKLFACLLLCSSALVCGCGGSSSPSTTDTAATTQPGASVTPGQEGTGDAEARGSARVPSQVAENHLAPSACKALPPAAAESFDRRLSFQGAGGSLDSCSYSSPPEQAPSLQLILELIPSPAEPSESAARTICHKLIDEITHDPDYEGSEAVPALGEESNVASGFVPAESNLDEDETIYVADWREDGSCARLIYGSTGSGAVEPLSEFIALAESIGASGISSSEQTTANSAATENGGATAAPQANSTSSGEPPDPCSYFSDSSIERTSGESIDRHVHGVDYTLPSECDWVGGEMGYPVAILTIEEIPANLSNPAWEMFREEGGEPISPPCDRERGYALPNPIRQQLRCGMGNWDVDLDIVASRSAALAMLREVLSTLPE